MIHMLYENLIHYIVREVTLNQVNSLIKNFVKKELQEAAKSAINNKIKRYTHTLWKERNEEFLSWEKTVGISRHRKKNQKYTNSKPVNKQTDNWIEITNKCMEQVCKGTQIFDSFNFGLGRTLVR